MLKLDQSTIDMVLKSRFSWKANHENQGLTKRLIMRKLISKTARGLYVTNPAFLKMFEGYVKPKEEKRFMPRLL